MDDSAVTEAPSEGSTEMTADDFFSAGLNEGTTEVEPSSGEAAEQPSESEETTSEDAYVFEGIKSDGETEDLTLSKEEAAELIRKGRTFDKRMSQLDRERKAFEEEKNKPLSEEEIQLRAQISELNSLRSQDPELYAELVNQVNKRQIEKTRPKQTKLEERIAKLQEVAEKTGDVPVLKDLVETINVLKAELEEQNQKVAKRLSDLDNNTNQVTETMKQREVAAQRVRLQAEAAAARQSLIDAGVPEDAIKKKAPLVNKYYRPGESLKDLTEMVFAAELAAAKAGTQETKSEETSPKLMKSSGGASGAAALSDDYDALSNALFGRVVPTPAGATK